MVSGITGLLTSSTLSSISQSTTASVSIETGLKAIGRPSFILADRKIDSETKRYAATKEFLYQATCFAVYMTMIIPIFKKGSFKLAKKVLKEETCFNKFNDTNHYLNYKKLASMTKNDRLATLKKDKYSKMFNEELLTELRNKDKPEPYNMIKGVIEFGNIIGSVLGLAIIAPQISHIIVHPALKLLGMEKDD